MSNKRASPPALFLRFFRWFCDPQMLYHIEGDLMELYHERLEEYGKRKAGLRFCIDVILLCRPGIIKPSTGLRNPNHLAMYKSYFTIGWRNLLKNKGYSIINITGLALGMAVTITIGLWIHDELIVDSQFAHGDRLAWVMLNQSNEGHNLYRHRYSAADRRPDTHQIRQRHQSGIADIVSRQPHLNGGRQTGDKQRPMGAA